MPMRSTDASRRGARLWRRRSAKKFARAGGLLPTGCGSVRSVVWQDRARRPGSTRQALDLARQQKERWSEPLVLHQLGVVYAHTDPPDAAQAEAHYQQALALAEELGMHPLQAHCHLGLGTLHTKTGQPEQARVELSTALGLYRTMEMTFWLPQVEAALAQMEC